MSVHAVVLCEGYHDRAFLSGWIEHRGWAVPALPVTDPLGQPVNKGSFAFKHERSGSFLKIQPCNGVDAVFRVLRNSYGIWAMETHPSAVHEVLVCVDLDDVPENADKSLAALQKRLEENQQAAERPRVRLLAWRAGDGPRESLPELEELDRLVLAALLEVHPARGPVVERWLASRPDPPPADKRERTWSHMAGWYAKLGCDAWWRQGPWGDAAVVRVLEQRLQAIGATAWIEQVEAPQPVDG